MIPKIRRCLRFVGQSVSSLLFPPLCLHCNAATERAGDIFCSGCAKRLEMVDSRWRCPYCFGMRYDPEAGHCLDCARQAAFVDGLAATFDYEGPAVSLVNGLTSRGQPYLAKGAAAFLAVQWARLQWPFPDVLIPLPGRWVHRWDRGYHPCDLLAEQLGKLLERPVRRSLTCRRKGNDGEDRFAMQLRQGTELRGKTVLLVADLILDHTALARCAEAVSAAHSKYVYAMALCIPPEHEN